MIKMSKMSKMNKMWALAVALVLTGALVYLTNSTYKSVNRVNQKFEQIEAQIKTIETAIIDAQSRGF